MQKRAFILILIFVLLRTVCGASDSFADCASKTGDAESAYKEGMELFDLAKPSDVLTEETIRRYEVGYARYGRDRNNLFAKAIECFRQAISLDPRSSNAYNSMGNAFREWGMYSTTEALNAYAKAGEVDSTFPWGYKNSGDLLLRNKKYEGAITSYKSFLKFETKYGRAEVLFKLSTIYEALGKQEEALTYFRNAIEVSAPFELWKGLAEDEIQKLQKTKIR